MRTWRKRVRQTCRTTVQGRTIWNLKNCRSPRKAAMLSGGSEWDSRGNEPRRHPQLRDERRPPRCAPPARRRRPSRRLASSKPATCFPTAGTVASSWDPALAEEMGKALGNEAHDLDVNVLLGPGLNIKRNPLCGRNFEYYSEDPIVGRAYGSRPDSRHSDQRRFRLPEAFRGQQPGAAPSSLQLRGR